MSLKGAPSQPKPRDTAEELQRKSTLRLQKAEERKIEAEKSVAEHRAKGKAVIDNTVRLRALRLAKEADEARTRLSVLEQKAQKKKTPRKKAEKSLAVGS